MTMDISHLDDDAISASVDGVLEDAAGQSHLAGCAICSARRDQLAAARSALAEAGVEPVDELTRRRLVTIALAEAGPAADQPAADLAGRRQSGVWYRRPALAGGVAAVILALFVAVPFLTGGRGQTGTDHSATASLEMAGGEFLGDLGDLSDPSALRERFGAQRALALSDAAKTAGGTGAASTPTPAAPPSPTPVAGRPGEDVPAEPAPELATDTASEAYATQTNKARDGVEGDAGLDRTVADACARTLADGPARGSELVAVATGTYQGTPAVVAVFKGERGTTAYVAARDGCRLLTRYQI